MIGPTEFGRADQSACPILFGLKQDQSALHDDRNLALGGFCQAGHDSPIPCRPQTVDATQDIVGRIQTPETRIVDDPETITRVEQSPHIGPTEFRQGNLERQ